jgi:hypothetical protein
MEAPELRRAYHEKRLIVYRPEDSIGTKISQALNAMRSANAICRSARLTELDKMLALH